VTRREPMLWLLGAAGIALLGVLEATLFYSVSPLLGFAVPFAIAIAIAVVHRPQLGVCAGIASVPLDVLHASGGSFQLTALKALLVLSAGAIVLRAIGARHPADRLKLDPLLIAYGLGLVWMLTGFAHARDPAIILKMLVTWAAFGIVALYVANGTPRQIRQVLWSIVVSAAATSLFAIANGSAQQARDSASAVEGRATGSFTHPNQLAFFLVMALPTALIMAVRPGRTAQRLFAGGSATVIFVALVLTLTRGAFIGIGVALIVMLTWAPFRRVIATTLILLGVIAAVNFNTISHSKEINLVGARIATIGNSEEANQNNERLRIWSTVPQIWSDHPLFGIGLGNFHSYSLQYGLSEGGQPFEHAHNITLTVLVEQGPPGLVLFLLTLFFAVRAGLVALRRRESPTFPLALAVIAGLAGLFVNGLTDYPPGDAPNMALILIEMGVLLACARQISAESPAPGGRPRRPAAS
jgi:putative inorganic carbon (HCO3(-)) transporter